MYIESTVKGIKYWLKIVKMPDSRYVKGCYEMLKILDGKNHRTWVTYVREILMKYGFGNIWLEQGAANETIFISELRQHMKDC